MKRAAFLFVAALASALVAVAQDATAAQAATGLPLIAQDRELPWNDVVMVVILMLAFSGGTLAIVRSSRRR
ncbi:MAG: hypothetical protein WD557_09785 [Dehalococcoidia bacterium]